MGVVLLLVCTLAAGHADYPLIRRVAGAPAPAVPNIPVVLEKMLVAIDLYSDRAEVDSTFLLHNTGEATSVQLEFPEIGELGAAVGRVVVASRFEVRVDGHRLSRGIGEGLWDVGPVRVGANERRVVEVKYGCALLSGFDDRRFFEYVMGGAAGWQGAISHCMLTVDVHYEDRASERFEVPLGMYGRDHYEFVRDDFEPSGGAELRVDYFRADVGVTVAGLPVNWRGMPPYPYVEDGRVWVAARMLADWLGASLEPKPSGIVLTRGSRRLALEAGSPIFGETCDPSRLGVAPRLEGGRLVVPLRPVATALGASVQYRPQANRVEVSYPEAWAFRAAAGLTAQQRLYAELSSGWAPPPTSSYPREVAAEAYRDGSVAPWIAGGDFTGGGYRDLAVVVQRGDEWGIAAFRSDGGGGFGFYWVDKLSGDRLSSVGVAPMVIRAHPPCRSAGRGRDDGARTTGCPTLGHDAIEVIHSDGGAVLYYWDPSRRGPTEFASAPHPECGCRMPVDQP